MFKIYLLFIITFTVNVVVAATGCLSLSKELKEPCDDKNYHLVFNDYDGELLPCPCPCKEIMLARGQCLDCGHFRYLKPGIIVRNSYQSFPAYSFCPARQTEPQSPLFRAFREHFIKSRQ